MWSASSTVCTCSKTVDDGIQQHNQSLHSMALRIILLLYSMIPCLAAYIQPLLISFLALPFLHPKNVLALVNYSPYTILCMDALGT